MTKEEKIEVYKDIANKVKDKFGIEYSIEEIHSITQSQFKILAYAFSKFIGIQLPYLGKFVPFDMDGYSKNVIIPNKELQQELVEAEKFEEANSAFLDSYRTFVKVKASKANEPELTVEQVMALPSVNQESDSLDLFRKLR